MKLYCFMHDDMVIVSVWATSYRDALIEANQVNRWIDRETEFIVKDGDDD